MTSLVNSRLDGLYFVEAVLGAGQFGTVYRARHIMLGHRVAIKVLAEGMERKVEALRRFRREGRAAVRVKHPNAVAIHDLRVSTDGILYLVMEYLEGRTLRAVLRERGPMPPAEVVDIAAPIAAALTAAHERGVVHRDVKPENVMLVGGPGELRTVKLLDLGLAKLMARDDVDDIGPVTKTAPGFMIGTLGYMSPEQFLIPSRDGNPEIDGRADVYALGVLVFEAVAGKRPVEASNVLAWRKVHLTTEPPLLRDLAPATPEPFGHAVARAIAKDRVDRYASPDDLVRDLRLALG